MPTQARQVMFKFQISLPQKAILGGLWGYVFPIMFFFTDVNIAKIFWVEQARVCMRRLGNNHLPSRFLETIGSLGLVGRLKNVQDKIFHFLIANALIGQYLKNWPKNVRSQTNLPNVLLFAKQRALGCSHNRKLAAV